MALAVRIRGETRGRVPWVVLHGFGSGGFAWNPVMECLPAGLTVIVPDLPGHAGSVDVEAGGAGRIAKAVVGLLDHLGIDRFHLAGHSLGGAAAALIALRAPERVASLLLVAPGGFGPEIGHQALKAYGTATGETGIATALEPFFADGADIPPSLIGAMNAARQDPRALPALKATLDAMLTEASGWTEQGVLPHDELARLPVPKTLIWGEQDRIVPIHQADGLDASFSVHRLAGKGHMLLDEAPGMIAGVLIPNLDDRTL